MTCTIKRILLLFCIIAICFDANASYSQQDSINYIANLKIQAEYIVENSDGDQAEAYIKLTELIENSLNFKEICKFVLGKYWNRLKEDQKSKFINEYSLYIKTVYTQNIYKYATQRLNILGASQISNGGYIVNATLIEDNNINFTNISFKLSEDGISDITISGVSLAVNQMSKLNDEIEQNGIDSVIQRLSSENQKSLK